MCLLIPLLPLLPWILGGGAAIVLYWLLKKFFKKKKEENKHLENLIKQIEEEINKKLNLLGEILADLSKDKPDFALNATLPKKFEPLQDLWDKIQNVTNQIQFSEKRAYLSRKIGEKTIPSKIPTDEIEIRNMQNISELPKALSGDLGADDDLFYAKIATNNILITQPIERIDVIEEKNVLRQKILRLVVDVSGSTKGERNAWNRILCKLLLHKANKFNAEYSLTTFDSVPQKHDSGSSRNEMQKLQSFIDSSVVVLGGTNINAALKYEIDLIKKDNEETGVKQDTQIVLVTDGTEGINEDFVSKALKQEQVILHSVLLGNEHQQLKNVSNKYHHVFIPSKQELVLAKL